MFIVQDQGDEGTPQSAAVVHGAATSIVTSAVNCWPATAVPGQLRTRSAPQLSPGRPATAMPSETIIPNVVTKARMSRVPLCSARLPLNLKDVLIGTKTGCRERCS